MIFQNINLFVTSHYCSVATSANSLHVLLKLFFFFFKVCRKEVGRHRWTVRTFFQLSTLR